MKLGGGVESSDHREYGYATVKLAGSDPLLKGLTKEGAELNVWMSHGDRVEKLPPGFAADRVVRELAARGDGRREAQDLRRSSSIPRSRTPRTALEIIRRFVLEICGCEPSWTAKNIVAEHLDKIRAQVGSDRVLLGLSGGVDSTVVAAMLHAAIGDQLLCVFVDTGLLRLDEGDQVMSIFTKHLGANVIRANAETEFLAALDGVADPEGKRKIIGRVFVEVFEREAAKLDERALARAGHDLSRRDRVCGGRDGQGASDQVASQRRRLAREDEAQAARAAARSLQRRSAPHRRRARLTAAT